MPSSTGTACSRCRTITAWRPASRRSTGLNGRDGNGSLIQPLCKLALFNRPDGTPVAFYQYQQSEQLGALDAERRQQRIDAGAVPLDSWSARRARRAAGSSRRCWPMRGRRAMPGRRWPTLLDAKAGADGPSTTAVRDLLPGIIEVASALRAAPRPPMAAGRRWPLRRAPEDVGGGGGGGRHRRRRLPATPGRRPSREDALRALGEIANFFRRTEPHSPLSYTLDEAVRRGRMTWPELLAEVVADMDARNSILTTLGIRPPRA